MPCAPRLTWHGGVMKTYNTSFFVVLYITTLIYMVLVLVPSKSMGLGDIGTARIALTATATVSGGAFYFAWAFLFRNRPARSRVPQGMRLLTCGFQKVLSTTKRIQSYPALVWLMTSIAFAEAAAAALISIATTYLKQVLQMDATEIGLVFLSVLLAGIPGSKLAAHLSATGWDPIHNLILCNLLFVVSSAASVVFLMSPDDKSKAYVFGFLWGIGIGWLHPMEISAYISLTEPGQEAEMMGLYLLLHQILSWLPPLVFTLWNENGFAMTYGMGSLSVFFVVSTLSLCCMGDYDDALRTLSRHHHSGDAASANDNYDNTSLELKESSTLPVKIHNRLPNG